MSSSLIKFANTRARNQRMQSSKPGPAQTTRKGKGKQPPVHWYRVDLDGLPYRGPVDPTLDQEQMDDRLAVVCDPHNRLFDLTDKADNKAYLEVVDKIVNGWWVLTRRQFYERLADDGTVTLKVYMEWVERYLENGDPAPFPPKPINTTGMRMDPNPNPGPDPDLGLDLNLNSHR